MTEADVVIEEAKASGGSLLRLGAIQEGVAAARSLAPISELRGKVSGELTHKGPSQHGHGFQVHLPVQVDKGSAPLGCQFLRRIAIEAPGEVIEVESEAAGAEDANLRNLWNPAADWKSSDESLGDTSVRVGRGV